MFVFPYFLNSCRNFFALLRPGPISHHFSSAHFAQNEAPPWIPCLAFLWAGDVIAPQYFLGIAWKHLHRALLVPDKSQGTWQLKSGSEKEKACTYCHRTKRNWRRTNICCSRILVKIDATCVKWHTSGFLQQFFSVSLFFAKACDCKNGRSFKRRGRLIGWVLTGVEHNAECYCGLRFSVSTISLYENWKFCLQGGSSVPGKAKAVIFHL